MAFILKNWKGLLIALVALCMVWAFTPSCATRKGAEAEQQAQEAIQSAKIHEGKADALQEIARQEAERRQPVEAERDALQKDKTALVAEVVRLRRALPARPVVGKRPGVPDSSLEPGGVAGTGGDAALVQQLYDVVDAQGALDAKNTELEDNSSRIITSLKMELKTAYAYGAEQKARGDELQRALVAKDLQIQAVKAAGFKRDVRVAIITALVVGTIEEVRHLKK
jgi:hypothetical protein